MNALHTRLTQALNLRHPILSAPMAFAGGGRLAAAVSRAGALGYEQRLLPLPPFLVGGGMTGMKWRSTGAVTGATDRPLAP